MFPTYSLLKECVSPVPAISSSNILVCTSQVYLLGRTGPMMWKCHLSIPLRRKELSQTLVAPGLQWRSWSAPQHMKCQSELCLLLVKGHGQNHLEAQLWKKVRTALSRRRSEQWVRHASFHLVRLRLWAKTAKGGVQNKDCLGNTKECRMSTFAFSWSSKILKPQ